MLVEHTLFGLAVAAAKPIPESCVLPIVVIERQMVDRVASSTVDNRVITHKLAVVDQDGPKIDENEQEDVGELLQGENEGKNVVGEGLGEAVDWVKGVGGEWGWHDPLMMRLVKALVDEREV